MRYLVCKISIASSDPQKFLPIDYYILACIVYSMDRKCRIRNCNSIDGLTVNDKRYRKKTDSYYFRYICREHNAEKKRLERKRNPSYLNRATDNYRKKFKAKHRARLLARKSIPLEPCQVCGSVKSMRHHEDYEKPLEVVFLCALHHKQVHAGTILCPK